MTKVSPSILSADFASMGEACHELETYGADYIHCDVMDGTFVDQITFGHKMIKDIKRITKIQLDVHLMIVNPLKHVENFAKAGSSIITLHYETLDNVEEAINTVKNLGVKVGLSIKPGTAVEVLKNFLPFLDLVLIMSVEPGKGGQGFMDSALDKVAYCREYAQKSGRDIMIEVDGGINEETGRLCVDMGANLLVAGSYIFGAESRKLAIDSLKNL